MRKIAILGLGSHLPETVLTNDEISRMVDTTDEWIVSRTGIRQRHIVAPGENNSDIGAKAARKALSQAGMEPEAITHVLYATCTGEFIIPSTACMLSDKLGISGRFALDTNAACSGWLFSLEVARGMLAASPDSKILLGAGEVLSSRINWKDRSTCVLFGDGASAMVLGTAYDNTQAIATVVDIETASDGSLGHLLYFGGAPASGKPYVLGDPVGEDYFIHMDGRDVYKHAVRNMAAISRKLLDRNGLSIDDVDMLVPHQANMRIIEAVGARLEVPAEKVYVNLQDTGNTSAASIPLALSGALAEGRIRPGMLALACAFGGGLTWGAVLLRF